jgi:hypothetical protein
MTFRIEIENSQAQALRELLDEVPCSCTPATDIYDAHHCRNCVLRETVGGKLTLGLALFGGT